MSDSETDQDVQRDNSFLLSGTVDGFETDILFDCGAEQSVVGPLVKNSSYTGGHFSVTKWGGQFSMTLPLAKVQCSTEGMDFRMYAVVDNACSDTVL